MEQNDLAGLKGAKRSSPSFFLSLWFDLFFSLFQFKCVYFVAKFYTRTSLQTLDYHTHTYTDDKLLAFAWAITVMLRPNYSLLVMCMNLYCELLCRSLLKSGLRSSHSLLISAVNHVLCSNCSKYVHVHVFPKSKTTYMLYIPFQHEGA